MEESGDFACYFAICLSKSLKQQCSLAERQRLNRRSDNVLMARGFYVTIGFPQRLSGSHFTMNDTETRQLIDLLDKSIDKEKAKVLLTRPGRRGPFSESKFIANKEGFLRFGIEIMKAAYAEKKEKNVVPVDIKCLLLKDSNIVFDKFERHKFDDAKKKTFFYKILDALLDIIIVGILVVVFVVGVYWLVGLLFR
ncbi:MAG TPA: hypothetical protein ENK26_05330 [Gammaproteobacteria bacterium]|nr:hypothetical protein [Gammaproteobacteria bacterium]